MHFVCTYTSGYFPIYDDEYRRVRYNADALHDTPGYVDFRTSLRTTYSVMMGPRGANRLRIHARTCGSCLGKYYTSNFVRIGGHPYDGFNDRSLDHELHVFAFLTRILGSLTEYFLKY